MPAGADTAESLATGAAASAAAYCAPALGMAEALDMYEARDTLESDCKDALCVMYGLAAVLMIV